MSTVNNMLRFRHALDKRDVFSGNNAERFNLSIISGRGSAEALGKCSTIVNAGPTIPAPMRRR